MPNPLENEILNYFRNLERTSASRQMGNFSNPVDLGRRAVNPQQAQPAPSVSSPVPDGILSAPNPSAIGAGQTAPNAPASNTFNLGKVLLQMGVPLASVIAGLSSPKLLPGAAGLSTGYAAGFEKERELQKKKETPSC